MEENIGLFVIDLSECSNTGEIINNVSLALEIPNASGRRSEEHTSELQSQR